MLSASHSRLQALLGSAVLLASCAVITQAQSNPATPKAEPNPRLVRPLVLTQTRYQLRSGEARKIDGPRETVDFVRNAKSRSIRIGGQEAKGFVLGQGVKGGEALLAASLTMKPGEYTLTVSAVSETGEERQAALAVTVKALTPVPSTTIRPPVVLLNGWQIGPTSSCPVSSDSSVTFGSLAQYLEADGVSSVYFFDNCVECPNCKIEDLGNTLGQFLNLIHYDTGALVPQIDLVTHSMGGLIARAYLAGLQDDGSLLPPQNPRIRRLILIAEPNFGSFIATSVLGVQTAEMIPGSAVLWELATWNQWGDDLRGVDALGVIGNAGSWNSLANASDGVVSVTSGSIGFARPDPSRIRILPYCHIDPSPLVDLFMDCSTSPGIARVDSMIHPTWTIIQSFLAGTSDWTAIGTTPSTDRWLSQYGGIYFGLQNATDRFVNDLTQVLFGGVSLQTGGASGTIFYNEFLQGTGAFQATSTSLGTLNCGTNTELTGHYTPWRCKFPPYISSVRPLLPSTPALVVQSGTTITVNGSGFGQACSSCQVLAVPAGSSVGYPLQISSWGDQTITASLPGTYNGFVRLIVQATSGQDSINIMAAPAPAIAVTNQSLQFTYTIGGTVPVGQSIQITNSGGGTLSWSAVWSAMWLTVAPTSGTAPSTLTVSVAPIGLTAGMYTDAIQISAAGAANNPLAVGVTLTVTPAIGPGQHPTLMQDSVRSVANGAIPNPPGSLIYAQGTNLASVTPKPLIATSTPLPTHLQDNLDDVSVMVNGTPAPMYYALPNYVAFQLPWETDLSIGTATMVVTRNGVASAPLQFPVGKFSPGIFTTAGSGVGLAWAIYALPSKINPKGTVAQPANSVPGQVGVPATGGDVLYIYAGGLGPVGPKTMPDGQAPCPLVGPCPAGFKASNYSTITKPVVMIGGVQATVTFSGLHPVYPGLYLVYFKIPSAAPKGNAVPIQLQIGGLSTDPKNVTLAIQ